MSHTQPHKPEEKKGGINPVVAAVTGVVIGATAAIAGAVVLSDEKNRKKVAHSFDNVKSQAMGMGKDAKKQAAAAKNDAADTITKGAEAVEKSADNVAKMAKTARKA